MTAGTKKNHRRVGPNEASKEKCFGKILGTECIELEKNIRLFSYLPEFYTTLTLNLHSVVNWCPLKSHFINSKKRKKIRISKNTKKS